MAFFVLSINPGSTSTKVALYEDEKLLFSRNVDHSAEELRPFKRIIDQFYFRKLIVLRILAEEKVDLNKLDAIVGRGGMVKPIEAGVYEMNPLLHHDLAKGIQGEHACSLGGLLAEALIESNPHARAFIADPVVVDEMQPVARLSGHPLFPRKSLFHALNQRAIGRLHAQKIGKKYEDLTLVIAHLGGGVTVGAHRHGKVVDVNNGIDGDGPFSANRSGTLPAAAVARLCFSEDYTLPEVLKMISSQGGLLAHLGTSDLREVEQRIETGDEYAKLVHEALVYNIAKEIGAMSTVLYGKVDAILLTGGIAHSQQVIDSLMSKISFIAPVYVYPGEDEMWALAMNGLEMLRGAPCKVYE
ncbi:butyrate kinase [Microbacter margulisiae]|uniref:Probable butyrate kinase n=1 Tax=Microbacter margulisiae TaxID=1350067 RepID=A0A7W5DRN1_9PORP|nr:butyrate kinase [Microbacter margulisiae]MBB3187314.1 butyrate kinase [Microbacter margulisiae]